MSEYFIRPLEYWHMGGVLLIPIAVACFGIWFCFLMSQRRLLLTIRIPDTFEKDFTHSVTRYHNTATGRCASMPGVIPGMVAHVLRAVGEGTSVTDAAAEYETLAMPRLCRDFIVLAALTGAAPLLGLLGTVFGMIETFDVVANAPGATTENVAGGISQALVTTQFGLVVAIPGVFGLARLQRLQRQVRTRLSVCKTHLLTLEAGEIGETERNASTGS